MGYGRGDGARQGRANQGRAQILSQACIGVLRSQELDLLCLAGNDSQRLGEVRGWPMCAHISFLILR